MFSSQLLISESLSCCWPAFLSKNSLNSVELNKFIKQFLFSIQNDSMFIFSNPLIFIHHLIALCAEYHDWLLLKGPTKICSVTDMDLFPIHWQLFNDKLNYIHYEWEWQTHESLKPIHKLDVLNTYIYVFCSVFAFLWAYKKECMHHFISQVLST